MATKGRYIYEWPRPMVTTDIVLFSASNVKPGILLIRRGREPFKGEWALPGGFVEMDEELDKAAARELAEETGIAGIDLEQMHTFGTIGRDPRGRLISVVFTGIAKGRPDAKAGDDADDAKWFDIDKLPEMAFDHCEIIKMAIKKLNVG